jgi:hypothetical protein
MLLRQSLASARAHDPTANWPADALDLPSSDPVRPEPVKTASTTEFDPDPTRRFPWSDDDSE